MKHNQSGSMPNAGKPEVDGSEQIAASAASGPNVEQGGASPSNTAPLSYKPVERILRWGVDSLYLSFKGTLAGYAGESLENLKLCAQSGDPREKAKAQWVIGKHAFMVHDKGAGKFAYVLSDPCFRISISKETSKSLPLAYVKVSARYLSTVTPQEAVKAATAILATFARVDSDPIVSRIDLFVDFVSLVNMESWNRESWITRASAFNQYAEGKKFTGWAIGTGGPIMMRLYDKNLEVDKSGSQYLRTLWDAGGWKDGQPVWRLEFEFKRETLTKLGLGGFDGVMQHLNGLWSYATTEWLRLCIPNPDDQNRARWPIHPVWAALSNLDFGSAEMPRLSRVVVTSAPTEESVVRRCVAALISLMALRSLVDLEEGKRCMGECIDTRIASEAYWDRIRLPQYVTDKIALKRRLFNMPASLEDPRLPASMTDEEIEAADYEIKASTEAYRKASRGR
jgi:hypothetical protein